MIITLIMDIMINIALLIFKVIMPTLPIVDIYNSLLTYIDVFTEIVVQAGNFGYFLLGDSLFIILPFVSYLLIFKYLVYPIYMAVRGVFLR